MMWYEKQAIIETVSLFVTCCAFSNSTIIEL